MHAVKKPATERKNTHRNAKEGAIFNLPEFASALADETMVCPSALGLFCSNLLNLRLLAHSRAGVIYVLVLHGDRSML